MDPSWKLSQSAFLVVLLGNLLSLFVLWWYDW